MFDTTHLVAFIVGTAVGAAGQYMADRLTDQRRKGEAKREAASKFERTSSAMPKLISEMREDLGKPEHAVVREFVALPNERVMFNSDRTRLAYFESVHPDLTNKIALLVEAGYIKNVSTTSTPIFRMTEEFVQRVRGGA